MPQDIQPDDRYPLTPLPWSPTIRKQALGLLLILLGVLLHFKFLQNSVTPLSNLDGMFYTNLAVNIRDGLGLVTDISLYHKGFSYFPHETSVYPLWPLLLGYSARIVDLDWLTRWLPTALYFGTLILAYILANRLYKQPLFPKVWPVLNAGHLAVIMLGSAKNFFVHSSLPYTEALSFFLLMACLLRAHKRLSCPCIAGGLELGFWCALLMTARSQLFLVALALWGALAIAMVLVNPKTYGKMAAMSMIAFVIGLAPWWLYLNTFVPDLGFHHFLRFDDYRENDFLAPVVVLKKTSGLWAFIVDRAKGIPLAFNGFGKYSYFANFNLFYFAFLVAIPLVIYDGISGVLQGKTKNAIAYLRQESSIFPIFAMLFAIGGLVSLHLIHKVEFSEWNFALRHALTAIFIFFISLVYLTRRPVLPQLYALILIVVGSYNSVYNLTKVEKKISANAQHSSLQRDDLISWLKAEQQRDDKLIVASNEPRRLALAIPGAGFHWTFRKTTIKDLNNLFNKLDTDFVIVRHEEPREAFMGPRHNFHKQFELVAAELNGFDIYKQR